MAPDTPYLYEAIAQELSNAITQGTYRPGERLPSLRQLSQRYKVSMATVLQVYQVLEDKGLLMTRPRSGYYVRNNIGDRAHEPSTAQPPSEPQLSKDLRIAFSFMTDFHAKDMIRMGTTASPDAHLLPLKPLARALAHVIHRAPSVPALYGEPQGYLELRAQIARRMADTGCYCSPEEIIITNGAQEALSLAIQTLAQRGDTVAIESPTYLGIIHILRNYGIKTLELPTHPRHGLDLDTLQQAISTHSIKACIFMPSCHNPFGAIMPQTNRKRLVEMLAQTKIPLIEDDAMGDLCFERPRPKAAKAYDQSGNVIYCGSFAKTLGAGHRIGWTVAGQYHKACLYMKSHTNVTTNLWMQMALAEFLSGGGYTRAVNKAVREYQKRLITLRQWVLEYFPEGTRVTNPQGGFLLWVELPEHIDALALFNRAKDKNIAIGPGILFSPTDIYSHHIRLSVGEISDMEVLHQATKTLGALASNARR